MPDLIGRWLALDWHDPLVVALVAAIAAIALWRRWALVLLASLVVALGQGVDYLLRHATLAPGIARGAVLAIYATGGAFLLVLATARFASKR